MPPETSGQDSKQPCASQLLFSSCPIPSWLAADEFVYPKLSYLVVGCVGKGRVWIWLYSVVFTQKFLTETLKKQ